MKNYFAKLRENEEKGFSLVELIIVMAIMAILVGVVASQVIPYMEKSRQAKDQQQLSGLATDITASLASAAVTAKSVSNLDLTSTDALKKLANDETNDGPKIEAEFCDLRNGASSVAGAVADVQAKLKSKAADDAGKKIFYSYDISTSKLTIYMTKDGSASGAKLSKLTVESE